MTCAGAAESLAAWLVGGAEDDGSERVGAGDGDGDAEAAPTVTDTGATIVCCVGCCCSFFEAALALL